MPTETTSNLSRKPRQPSIWILSPYHTGSHASWARGYQKHSRCQVKLLTMAGRFWKWRMQGSAIELAEQIRNALAKDSRPDLILATDMVHLTALQGLLRSELGGPLANTSFALYMHENQLTYPWRPGEKPDLTYAMLNWSSQLGADRIYFNSHYHLESWFGELPNLLKHYPDYNHIPLIETVRARSQVLPVGIECGPILSTVDNAVENAGVNVGVNAEANQSSRGDQPPLILWNQRWEYDKQPEKFFALLYRLQEAGIDFRLAVAGENFRKVPEEFEEARERLADQIVHWGFLESYVDYVGLLRSSDLVISTAIHEFFGISILEAIVAGAFPLLPNRLSYPELIPAQLHPACLYHNEDQLFEMALQRLSSPRPAPPSLQQFVAEQFDWPAVAAVYDEVLGETKI